MSYADNLRRLARLQAMLEAEDGSPMVVIPDWVTGGAVPAAPASPPPERMVMRGRLLACPCGTPIEHEQRRGEESMVCLDCGRRIAWPRQR